MRVLIGLLLLLATVCATERRFEVASIRPHPGPSAGIEISTSGLRLKAEYVSVADLIEYAYDIEDYQISVAEDTRRYDITARAEGEGEPSKAEFREMLQTLLAERFGLKFHRVDRQLPVYALVVGKGGPRLKKSTATGECSAVGGRMGPGGSYETSFSDCRMDAVVDELNGIDNLRRPVIDKTGLTGSYDMKLNYDRDMNPDSVGSSIFTALRDQLGLRLEAQRAAVQVLVVDHIESPSEN